MTPEIFVKTYYPEALKEEKRSGFHHLIPLTQAALESAWGSKVTGANNFFGIKDTDGVNGNEELVTTTEYLSTDKAKFPVILKIVKIANKFKYTIKDYFRKYPSAGLAFQDHTDFFLKNPRYKTAVTFKNNPSRFFEEISLAGYATDPKYSDSLKQVMKSVIKRLPK